MGDVKSHSSQQRKSIGRHPSVSDGEELKITHGTSGSTVSSSNPKSGIQEEEEDRSSSRTRRGRSSNLKGIDLLSNKLQSSDSDAKNGSPSGPAAYLNSVRNNLTMDSASSPMQDKSSTTSSGKNNNGIMSGYKLPQKRRNRGQDGAHHKPAEIFRKDLISAMKIPDTSQLSPEEYWVMRDPWRMEWEKGVQVPVNPGGLPAVKIESIPKEMKGDFRMPRKFIKTTPDVGDRDTVNLNILADRTCRYDLDEVDVGWLEVINYERAQIGLELLDEFTMEIIMEELETQCHENLQLAIQTKEGLGIEYDENIVCDVCKTPECEEGNEMVFCDGCNLCVHQACYGILKVPEGSWLCKPCALGIRGSAVCILCGKKGGAMKSTKSGRKWAHMSCALWIPEITIADPERMEPITKVSHIPSSRWSLLCTVCKERSVGACIQCSVRHCVTAYHVTCAMECGFDMITDCVSPTSAPNAGESAIIFRSYCQKHSKNSKKKSENSPTKKTEEEKRSDRQKRIAELEEDFFTLVKCKGVATVLNIPIETVTQVMEFWKLKRKANFNRPLVTPKQEEGKALEEAAETGLQRRLRMFTHLRQDLERVRNLCYMIGKREKMKRSSVKTMSNVFLAQIHYLEYRMSHSSNFDPISLISSLPKFGSPNILRMAKIESSELAKTKEWSIGSSRISETQPPDPGDDALEDDPPIRLPQPRANVSIPVMLPSEKPTKDEGHLGRDGRKNGLVVGKSIKDSRHLTKSSSKSGGTDRSEKKKQSTLDNLLKSEEKRVENRKRSQEPRPADSNSSTGENSDFTSARRVRSKKRQSTDSNRPETDASKNTDPLSSSESNRDTVNETDSRRKSHTRRGRLKSESKDHNIMKTSGNSTPELQRDSSVTPKDVRATTEKAAKNQRSTTLLSPKKLRKQSGDRRRELKQKSPSQDLRQEEKPRRSSRHLEFSNSDDSDSSGKGTNAQPKMTISTETISETRRYDGKSADGESRKRKWSKSTEKISPEEKSARKKPKLDSSQNIEDKSPLRRKSPRMRQNASSADESDNISAKLQQKCDDVDNLAEKPSTETIEPHEIDEKSPRRDSSPPISGKKNVAKRQAAKNGRGALAPSRGRSRSATCNKTGDTETGTKPARRLSGQGLVLRKDEDSPPPLEVSRTSPKRRSSSHGSMTPRAIRSPILEVDEPNPEFVAAGLDIGYGSNAPSLLRQTSNKKSSPKTKSLGLKWVSLGDDNTDSNKVFSGRAATPKDQEGYRGDMDESDSESQNSLQKHHHRRLSSRKRSSLNPGKYRTGIGVFSTKSSDSSEDDFDLSFNNNLQDAPEKSQRQKLRSISNTSPGPPDLSGPTLLPSTSSFSDGMSIKTQGKTMTVSEKLDKNDTGPKNVNAVGGIQGALKSERDLETTPFFTHTADGQDFQDNVFEKFSHFGDDVTQPTRFVDPMQNSGSHFGQSPLIPPSMLDFHGNGPFRGNPLFPYGAINPWQMSQPASLPSIIPNQYPLPVYYQYPPMQRPNIFENEVQPSPPPMPDSTLSPESVVPNSASVAVQASSDRSITPSHNFDKSEKKAPHPPTVTHDDNEWEVVQEGDGVIHGDDDAAHRHHHRKHKKKKKKKKRRRMYFPDGYDSEKRDTSSPAIEPIHGAIVPQGHSLQYDKDTNSNSEIASSSARTTSDTDIKTPPSPQKLVLKINKRHLIIREEKLESKIPSLKMPKEDLSSGNPNSQSTSGTSGLKLTFKKSQYEHLLKKHKRRRKFLSSDQKFSSYTVSPTPGMSDLDVKPKVERKAAALRRLGLDVNSLPNTDADSDGIGRRALRERKPSGKQEEKVPDKGGKTVEKRRPQNPGKKVANSETKLGKDPGNASSLNQSKTSVSVEGLKMKRGRGRPKKIRQESSTTTTVKQEPNLDVKPTEKKTGENRDLARFAGWSTKSSKTPSFKPRHSLPGLDFRFKSNSSAPHRSKPGGISIRSFSTDSDQTSTVSMSGQHPARHWKKRKVHEHENQVSELPNPLHSPDPSSSTASDVPTPRATLSTSIARELPSDISKPIKMRLNKEGHSMYQQGHGDKALTVASLPQAVRASTDYNPKTKTLNLDLGQMPPWSSGSKSDKGLSPSSLKQKALLETSPSSTGASKSVMPDIVKQADGEEGTATHSASSPPMSHKPATSPMMPKPKTPTTTPTKTFPPEYNLGFAMQTGPLNNFKIPKKLHQANAESNLPRDTLD